MSTSPAGARESVSLAAADPATESLIQELDALFASPTVATGVLGILVQSVDTGQILFRHQPDTLVVPGSNMKLLTMATAAKRLGWEFTYETRLESLEAPVGGVLPGDLFVVGSGDPTFNARHGDRLAAFRQWALELKRAGISRIAGRVVGDDDAFDEQQFGDEWSWNDFVYAYAAPVGALQFNENAVEVSVRPGNAPEAPAALSLSPPADLRLNATQMITGSAGSPMEIKIGRFPGSTELSVWGSIPVDGREAVVRAAVDNPTTFFVRTLRDVLNAEGITVGGDAVDIDAVDDRPALKASAGRRKVLLRHQSPTLAEIGKTMMKMSQNLYAETVFRTLPGLQGQATVGLAREAEGETLRNWGFAPGEYAISDGSGLSRLNFVTASTIVRLLRAVALDPALSADFDASLAVAGRDGLLVNRFRSTQAEGNVIAKTGTLTAVRALSGYVRTRDGERLAFAFLANNFLVPTSAIDALIDQAVERLANFSR
ncbi:MAG: D-alanyl-D-alanine carboxypeptidase/D-alanyl-D-alanine-endopeptidase [Vicinamibacterales bacterium]